MIFSMKKIKSLKNQRLIFQYKLKQLRLKPKLLNKSRRKLIPYMLYLINLMKENKRKYLKSQK